MKARLILKMLMLGTTILFWTAGCRLGAGRERGMSSEADLQTKVAGTMVALRVAETLNAEGAVPEPTQAVLPTATLTLEQIATASPTITLTPTTTLTPTLEVPLASVSVSTNCRTGPDTIYDNIGALMVGEQAQVVGQTSDGTYWIIENPDGSGECWLWAYYATVVGPTDGLPMYTPPPSPTPAFDWGGTWSVSRGPASGGFYTVWTMTAAVSGKEFTGSVDILGTMITFFGTISDDYMRVSGTWQEDPDETGPFTFYAVGNDQFNGNYSDGPDAFGMCGARGGAGYPDPCYLP